MTYKGKAVDAICGVTTGGRKVTRFSDIKSFVVHHNDKSDVMINGEYYSIESLEYCDFMQELRKVVDNG
jgi:hypothetical protein